MNGVFFAALALASAQMPGPMMPSDPRIQLVVYNPGQVVTLPVATGYAAVVDLGPDERVESVVVGNSADWEVTSSKRGDHVVVKPLAGASETNMVLITGDRRYVFLLQPASGDLAPFVLRFSYPDTAPISLAPDNAVITTFRFRGTKTLFPDAMSDDGKRTTIAWSRATPLPAIFAIEKGGHESIVNGRMADGVYVVERIADRFVFRLGKQRASAQRSFRKPSK